MRVKPALPGPRAVRAAQEIQQIGDQPIRFVSALNVSVSSWELLTALGPFGLRLQAQGPSLRRPGSTRRKSYSLYRDPDSAINFCHRNFDGRKIVSHGVPNCSQVDPFISMTELVSNSPNIPPWLAGNPLLRLISQPGCRFADDLQLPFDSRNGHWIRAERFENPYRR